MYNKYYEKALKYAHTNDAFLNAKVAAKKDDLPHLVHADYLEENNMPATAQFIRRVIERRHPNDRIYSSVSSSHEPYAEDEHKNGFVVDEPVINNKGDSVLYMTHRPIESENHYINYILHGEKEDIDNWHKALIEEGLPKEQFG